MATTTKKTTTSGPKWPHDHEAKHARAARKGWKTRRGQGSTVAKYGGSSAHTEKTHYLKPRTKAAPKKTATRAAPTAPKIVISQGADKRWRIVRQYANGHTAGQPGTYASKAAAERAAKGMRQGVVVKPAMFSEREESYGRGLFG